MPNDPAVVYSCVSCGETITNHAYLVQRRSVRPLKEILPDGTAVNNPPDFLDGFHAGIKVGPESDYYCDACYTKLPSFQELINDYKSNLDSASKNLA